MASYSRGAIFKMETCTNSLSDNFVLKGFPALKKEQERGKVFFCIKKEGRREGGGG